MPKTSDMLDQIDWLIRFGRHVDIDVETEPTQEIGADRYQMGKKVQAEITQIPNYQVILLNPSRSIFRKSLVAVGTLADSDMFDIFMFDVVAVIDFDACGAGIPAAAFKLVGQFFVYLHLSAFLQQNPRKRLKSSGLHRRPLSRSGCCEHFAVLI